MGRQELKQHIEEKLEQKSNDTDLSDNITDTICQNCGGIIDTDGEKQSDYVIHSIPAHGDSGMNLVFYCGPTCFQENMETILES